MHPFEVAERSQLGGRRGCGRMRRHTSASSGSAGGGSGGGGTGGSYGSGGVGGGTGAGGTGGGAGSTGSASKSKIGKLKKSITRRLSLSSRKGSSSGTPSERRKTCPCPSPFKISLNNVKKQKTKNPKDLPSKYMDRTIEFKFSLIKISTFRSILMSKNCKKLSFFCEQFSWWEFHERLFSYAGSSC